MPAEQVQGYVAQAREAESQLAVLAVLPDNQGFERMPLGFAGKAEFAPDGLSDILLAVVADQQNAAQRPVAGLIGMAVDRNEQVWVLVAIVASPFDKIRHAFANLFAQPRFPSAAERSALPWC
jgi:hypothetical protein